MKYFLNIILAAVALTAVSCTDSNKAYVRKAVRIMDKDGLFAEGPQWDAAKAEALAAAPATLDEAREVVKTALKVAGGKHSFLQDASSVTENATSQEWPEPEVTALEDGIVMIKLPPFSGNSAEGVKYAQTVLGALPDEVHGAVIDLRDNRGGNMYPMIAAVHRFLPDGETLRFRTRKRTQWITLGYAVQVAGVPQQDRIECPVAILTNEWTASSGEASANQPFPLPDGSNLVLTTGCDVARTGEVFCDDPLTPDVMTETPLEDALAWMKNLVH